MICKKCSIEFTPTKGLISYCSLQCRNSRGPRTDEFKDTVRAKLVGIKQEMTPKKIEQCDRMKKKRRAEYNKNPIRCNQCDTVLTFDQRNRKTCSDICKIKAGTSRTYQNGSRKTIYYKDVVLESTWELKVAQELDNCNISWTRPEPIKWVDSSTKDRLYYPDFYLVDHDVYLDPKNPYCMERDQEKMKEVSKQINIIYGPIDRVMTYIASVV